ncbi:MFS transporter [Micromonospora sp. NPDC005220]|uniref:MFS transporter n=1 Tax=Micromonospora sp. NPDC005220 TaxID=3155589 RepID=UPI0033A126E4
MTSNLSRDRASTREALSAGRLALLLAITCGTQLLVIFDETVVNLALPTIREAFGFSTPSLAWVVDAYMLMFGGFLLLGGRCADLFGRRRVFLAGLAVFTAASLAAGLARSSEVLVLSRGVQGFGAALLSPAALSILVSALPDAGQRARALGVWGGLSGIAGTTGVFLGGVITDTLGWRWIFLLNVGIGVLLAALVPTLRLREGGDRPVSRRLDGVGAALVTAGLLLLVFSVLGTAHRPWSDWRTLVGLTLGGLLLLIFFGWERRVPDPLVRLDLLTGRQPVLTNTLVLLTAASLYSIFFFLTLFMQLVHGWSPLRSGLSWMPFGLATAVFAGLAVQLTPRFGARNLMVVGLLLIITGQTLLLGVDATDAYASGLLPSLLLTGAGFGLVLVPVLVAAVSGVPREHSGTAAAILNTGQQVGGAVGLALVVTVANSRLEDRVAAGAPPPEAMLAALRVGFAAAALLAGLSVLVALGLPRIREKADLGAIHGG